MLLPIARTIGVMAAGAVVERMAHNMIQAEATTAPDPLPRSPKPLHGSGDQRLSQLAQRIAPADDASVVGQGLSGQIRRREKLLQNAEVVLGNPAEAGRQLQQSWNGLASDLQVVHGAANVASGRARISAAEAGAVVHAGVRKQGQLALDHLKNLDVRGAAVAAYRGVGKAAEASYVAGTTSEQGAADLTGAMRARLNHEVGAAAVGASASHAAAAVLGAIPHPAAKLAAIGIRASGMLAAGGQISEALHTAAAGDHPGDGAMAAAADVLREKSGWHGGATPSLNGGADAVAAPAPVAPDLLRNVVRAGMRELPVFQPEPQTSRPAESGTSLAEEIAARLARQQLQLAGAERLALQSVEGRETQ